MTNKKTVILRAPLLCQAGYGVHARQVARWLFKQQDNRADLEVVCEPLPWGVTPWITDVNAMDGLIGRILQSSKKLPSYNVSLQLQLPNEWNPFLADFNIGLTAAVEADRCNPEWIAACNRMDLIIVPSEFVKSVFTNTGEVKTRIEVVPEAFIDECLNENLKPIEELNLDTEFNFLVFSQFTGNNPENDRKNIPYTIKWFNEAFANNPNVGVVIKTNLGRQTVLDQMNSYQIVSNVVSETRKGVGPKFYLLHGEMTNEEVVGLYRHPKIKALVSLTHGEGFGLPLLEAATCELPVIATGWSAHTEFLGLGKYIKVDYALGPVHESRCDDKIYLKGFKWANPNEEDFKRKVLKFYQSPKIPQEWAKELATKLKSEYSQEAIDMKYSKVLESII